jgi:hypothetical protein
MSRSMLRIHGFIGFELDGSRLFGEVGARPGFLMIKNRTILRDYFKIYTVISVKNCQ